MKIIISANPERLREELSRYSRTATVEAEYGNILVEGSVLTLAHHGPRSDNPPPCLYNGPAVDVEAVGISHFDLDTLGGILAVCGRKPGPEEFWALAGYVDTHGPHRAPDHPAWASCSERIQAFWAWSSKNRIPSAGPAKAAESVIDVTEEVTAAEKVIRRIFDGDSVLIEEGRAFARAEAALEESSFLEAKGPVAVRVADKFVSHLYRHGSEVYRAIVVYNTKTGAVTISLEEGDSSTVSAAQLAKDLWGPEAGGRVGIAGSPRGRRMGLDDLVKARDAVVAALG